MMVGGLGVYLHSLPLLYAGFGALSGIGSGVISWCFALPLGKHLIHPNIKVSG
jgi:hypothetical protein